jgi:formyl-CoA transferase
MTLRAVEPSIDFGSEEAALPLAGLVVLDLTLARAGPTCARHLADWGANVILIQPPDDGGDEVIGRRESSDYQNLHRNKRAMTLNLKTEAGHATFLRMVEKADVVIENMRIAVKHRLKVSYDDLKVINPSLVYGSISGFGQSGPIAERPGVDQIAQGMGGLMSVTGKPGDGPMRTGIAIADTTAGNLLALGVMMALFQRERTGKGSWVHTSLIESMAFMLDFQAARYLATGIVPKQAGNDHPTAVPIGAFQASDGYINIGASSSRQFTGLCAVLGHPEWAQRPDWKTQVGRAADREAVHAAINSVTLTKSVTYWVETLSDAGIPCGPVYDIGQLFDDPQVRHLGIATPYDHPTKGRTEMLANPLNFEGTEKRIRRPAATRGDSTDEVLSWVGLDADEVRTLREKGAFDL